VAHPRESEPVPLRVTLATTPGHLGPQLEREVLDTRALAVGKASADAFGVHEDARARDELEQLGVDLAELHLQVVPLELVVVLLVEAQLAAGVALDELLAGLDLSGSRDRVVSLRGEHARLADDNAAALVETDETRQARLEH